MNRKNVITIIMTLVLGMALTGQIFTQTKLGPRTESFFKTFSSGTYHMKTATLAAGVNTEMELFIKGDMVATTMSSQGETVKTIIRDNKAYMIMEQMKMIMITPSQGIASTGAINTAGISFTGSGTAVFAGKNLPYEEYADNNSIKSQFFIDGNRLAGIRNISSAAGTFDMVISVLDQNVPDSVFNIPASGYMVQDMSNIKF